MRRPWFSFAYLLAILPALMGSTPSQKATATSTPDKGMKQANPPVTLGKPIPFVEIVNRLKSRTPPELHRIANSASVPRGERAAAICSLFANHLRVPADTKAVGKVMVGEKWLDEASLEKVTMVLGSIPVKFKDSVFLLRLFPDKEGWSEWAIYLRLAGRSGVTVEEARAFLCGGGNLEGTLQMVEFALSGSSSMNSQRDGPSGSPKEGSLSCREVGVVGLTACGNAKETPGKGDMQAVLVPPLSVILPSVAASGDEEIPDSHIFKPLLGKRVVLDGIAWDLAKGVSGRILLPSGVEVYIPDPWQTAKDAQGKPIKDVIPTPFPGDSGSASAEKIEPRLPQGRLVRAIGRLSFKQLPPAPPGTQGYAQGFSYFALQMETFRVVERAEHEFPVASPP